tara:strand:+ start:2360 stop:2551 length:192 start_codon:yes stop_codon:yes gene_type:complete
MEALLWSFYHNIKQGCAHDAQKCLRQSGGTADSGLDRVIFNANLTEADMRIIDTSFLLAAMGH